MAVHEMGFGRRGLLKGMVAAGAGVALGPFGALGQRSAVAGPGRADEPVSGDAAYGPLYPTRDHTTGLPLLMLPRGFEYLSLGWTNDPMSDGTPTPGSHDGMAAFRIASASTSCATTSAGAARRSPDRR